MIAVPIAKRLGLGSALGYLLAGMIIGPNILALVGKEGQDVMHFAEFGVVLMLFLVGLELQPSVLYCKDTQWRDFYRLIAFVDRWSHAGNACGGLIAGIGNLPGRGGDGGE